MKDYANAGCIVHCNKVNKPVKGKYLLLCMISIMYLLLTWYTLIMFLKVLSHLISKIKNFMKYFKKGSWNISKISWNFLIFQSEIFHRASLIGTQIRPHPTAPKFVLSPLIQMSVDNEYLSLNIEVGVLFYMWWKLGFKNSCWQILFAAGRTAVAA